MDTLTIDVLHLRVADFFAGVGGFHKGIGEEVSEFVVANDMNEKCKTTYSYNFPNTPFICDAIESIETLPDFDIFCGGFPCQPFSIAGQRKGFEDERGQVFLLTHDNGNTLKVIL